MKKTIFMSLCLLIMFCFSVNGYAKGPSKVITWKMATVWPPGDDAHELTKVFTNMVNEIAKGKMEIKLYAGNELVKTADTLEACKRGMVNIQHSVGAYFKGKVPLGEVEFGLPMSWRDGLEVHAIYDAGFRDIMREEYAKHGLYFITEVPYLEWTLMTTNKPIRKLEDFKGLKLRASGAFDNLFTKLGATTVFLHGGEIYTAMQLGTIDGAGWGANAWDILNWKDVCKYYLATAPGFGNGHVLVNMKDWKALPDDLKNIVSWSAERFARTVNVRDTQITRDILASLPEGIKTELPASDIAKMRKIAVTIWDDIAKKSPQTAKGIQFIKDYLRAHKVID